MIGSKLIRSAAVASLAFISMTSQAATVTYVFNTTNSGSGFTTPSPNFGTVVLTDNGSNVDVTVTLASGFDFVSTGAGNGFLFAFNLTNPTGATFSTPQFASRPSTNGQNPQLGTVAFRDSSNDPPPQFSEFRTFDWGILCLTACSGGSDPWGDPLTFTVYNRTTANFNKLSFNVPASTKDTGAYFAADVFGQGKTGVIASTGPGTPPPPDLRTPEPTSLGLLGLGLAGLGLMRRRKFS